MHLCKLFLDKIKDNESPKVNGDGTQIRDFVHVSDVVNANILSMKSDIEHEFFNVGTSSSITILELAKVIIKLAKLDLEPVFGPALEGDVDKTLSDTKLIREKIDWKPTITLEEWLNEIVSSKKIDYI